MHPRLAIRYFLSGSWHIILYLSDPALAERYAVKLTERLGLPCDVYDVWHKRQVYVAPLASPPASEPARCSR